MIYIVRYNILFVVSFIKTISFKFYKPNFTLFYVFLIFFLKKSNHFKKAVLLYSRYTVNFCYISVLPIIALDNVTSSAYSKSPPTESPWANLVTVIPIGLTNLDIYIAVDSPSKLGFIAKINSFTS